MHIVFFFLGIYFSSETHQIFSLIHIHQIYSISSLRMSPFNLVSIIHNKPRTIVIKIGSFFIKIFQILCISWSFIPFYKLLIEFRVFFLSIIKRKKMFSKFLTKFFIVITSIMPSVFYIKFKGIMTLNLKIQLIYFVKLVWKNGRVWNFHRND